MGRKKGPTLDRDEENKKFAKLDEEWRSSRLSEKDPQKLVDEITKCAMEHIALGLAQKEDPDIIALQGDLTAAREMYNEGKAEKLIKIEFLMEELKGRNHPGIPSLDDFLSAASKRQMARKERKGKAETVLTGVDPDAGKAPAGYELPPPHGEDEDEFKARIGRNLQRSLPEGVKLEMNVSLPTGSR
jgi:hypothetical protein